MTFLRFIREWIHCDSMRAFRRLNALCVIVSVLMKLMLASDFCPNDVNSEWICLSSLQLNSRYLRRSTMCVQWRQDFEQASINSWYSLRRSYLLWICPMWYGNSCYPLRRVLYENECFSDDTCLWLCYHGANGGSRIFMKRLYSQRMLRMQCNDKLLHCAFIAQNWLRFYRLRPSTLRFKQRILRTKLYKYIK